MNEIEVLLIQAWKLSMKQGKTALAESIADCMSKVDSKQPVTEEPPFEPDRNTNDAGFKIPSGKFRGKYVHKLSDEDLQNVWSGFNGCGNTRVAGVLRRELVRRGIQRW